MSGAVTAAQVGNASVARCHSCQAPIWDRRHNGSKAKARAMGLETRS